MKVTAFSDRSAIDAIDDVSFRLTRISSTLRLLKELPPTVRPHVVTLVQQQFAEAVDALGAATELINKLS
jgi:hypothetical protein